LKNLDHSIYLDALNQINNKPYVPVWFLRQAGRYMPEYRAVRSKFSDFFEMIKQPEICCELTMQPLDKFPLDAAITFSDILTVPEAMGLEIKFIEKKGPVFSKSIIKDRSLNLSIDGINEKLNYVYQATTLIKSNINIPLIGFAGSPWTIFTYMFYGESPKDFNHINEYLKNNSDYVHQTLEQITNVSIQYLESQIKYGADCVQIFDSWGGILQDNYQEFSLQYINKIKESLPKDTPCILYSRGMTLKPYLNNTSLKCFNLDSGEKLDDYLIQKIAIQGNINPQVFHKSETEIKTLADDIYYKYKSNNNYVCNLGSGITPDIDPNKVGLFLNRLRLLNSE